MSNVLDIFRERGFVENTTDDEGIHELLAALRLRLGEETSPETGALPLATITSIVSSQLPGDDIVLQTTQLSGVPRFTSSTPR